MDGNPVIAAGRQAALADLQTERGSPEEQRLTGVSPGINIEPGSSDDGWEVPPPVRLGDGTQVQLYKDGQALQAAYAAIAQARFRIGLEVYIFRSDDTGWKFAELLAKRARQGLRVYLIYDSYGSLDSDSAMFEMMTRSGVRSVELHPFWPWDARYRWRPTLRDHRKLLVIDDDTAGLGGINIGAEYAGSWVVKSSHREAPWRDNAIGLRGPSARLMADSFARTWRYAHSGERIINAELVHNLHDGDMGLLASVPTRRSPLRPLIQRLICEATSSILITVAYFAPPDDMVDALCAAARRGVKVRLMLPGLSDVSLLIVAARAFYDKLLDAGVEIFERQGAILHAKTLCIDGRTCIVGSANLDYRTFEMNMEISALIRSPALADQLNTLFENDIRYARHITPRQGRNRPRPVWDRVVQWAVDRARSLL